MKRIATITVNYRTADLTLEAVESLISSESDRLSVHVHVVDNASPGDDGDLIETAVAEYGWLETVELHREKTNHGFGRGNNVVLKKLAALKTRPEYIFFLNPDARVEQDTLEVLSRFLDCHPEAAVAGASIFEPRTDHEAVAAFRFPSLLTEFISSLQFGPVSRAFPSGLIALGTELPTMQVDWVSGAAFMARFDALEKVGFFEDAFFLYYEEVDLMRKLRNAGWQTWHVSEAHVFHSAGSATGVGRDESEQASRLPDYWYESWRIYMLRHHGAPYTFACGTLKILGWLLNSGIRGLQGKRSEAPRRFLRDLWSIGLKPLVLPGHGKT
ncbi:glycosyltransferase family 2 protein [Roseovarius aestuariivivens]|uniref:glycosyltransferase family 2 protein n=1 Tax=Roseovarius aestuariivivens TaxID=1888910 RepID=UPI0014367BCE|nr:glycosyltransferase family 2 protein [Roseovarius aestuariivivens]